MTPTASLRFIGLVILAACTNTGPNADKAASTRATDDGGHASAGPIVVLKTSLGAITVELNRQASPVTVNNFLRYVDEKFYDGTIFHDVVKGFMIQGGGYTAGLAKKTPHEAIVNESRNGLSNSRGTIAMARLLNNPDSAMSEFFINVVDSPYLDFPRNGGYAVFGRIVDGLDVVDKIAAVPIHRALGGRRVPDVPVVIESVRLK